MMRFHPLPLLGLSDSPCMWRNLYDHLFCNAIIIIRSFFFFVCFFCLSSSCELWVNVYLYKVSCIEAMKKKRKRKHCTICLCWIVTFCVSRVRAKCICACVCSMEVKRWRTVCQTVCVYLWCHYYVTIMNVFQFKNVYVCVTYLP